jgi:hypothetical protein
MKYNDLYRADDVGDPMRKRLWDFLKPSAMLAAY